MPTKRVAIYNIATNTLWNGMYLYLCIYKVGLLICHKLSIQGLENNKTATNWEFAADQQPHIVQGDHSGCVKAPVDFKAKVPFWYEAHVL